MRNNNSTYINKRKVFILCISYDILMMFYQLLPKILVSFISLMFVICLFVLFYKKVLPVQSFFYIMITFIPTSFVSIIGTSFGQFPFTWFIVFTIALFFTILFYGKLDSTYLLLFLLFTLVCCITLLNIQIVYDALKQIMTILLFLCSFIIGEYLKRTSNSNFIDDINFLYVTSVIGFSAGVFLQRQYILKTGNIIGHYTEMGAGRVTYAGLMDDYSFATLYIATGAILLLVLFFEKKSIKFYQFIILELFFILSMLVVNSRTGLFAFIFISAVYLIKKSLNGNLNALLIGFILLLCLPVFYRYMTISRVGQSLLDSSGRVENYIESIKIFSEHRLFGVGFGLANLKSITGLAVPHNFFIQYLVQCGISGTFLIVLNFIVLFKNSISRYNNSRWLLYAVLAGSMFIPDVVSSRFLSVTIIMVIINSQCAEEALCNTELSYR